MTETLSASSTDALIHEYIRLYPAEAARRLEQMDKTDMVEVFESAPLGDLLEVIRRMNPDVIVPCIADMSDGLTRSVFSEIDPMNGALLLARLDENDRDGILSLLANYQAREYRDLMDYPPDSAGSFMDPRVTMFSGDSTVEEALAQLRSIKDRRVLDLCLVDSEQRLIGLVPIQNIVQADPAVALCTLSHGEPIRVPALAPRDDVVKLLEEQKLTSLPVVDLEGQLLGVIRYDALVSAAQAEVSEDLQAMFGAGREERALSKVWFAVRKRLPWLEINLGTAFLASFVVGLFEDTIAQITALAVFLPVVAGQSGNTGSQALAVAMRGLALREITSRDWWRLMRKEAGVGLINGVVVATTTGLIVAFWTGIAAFGIVIGISMVLSMVIAGASGAVIPILLKSIGQDPAQSSSIILTTVTDIVGFMSFLGLATLMMSMLVT